MLKLLFLDLSEALHHTIGFDVLLAVVGITGIYLIFFYLLRSLFRRFERDIALVTLNVSEYPALTLVILICLKILLPNTVNFASVIWLARLLLGGIIISASYWCLQLFNQVLVYYLKEYAETTEILWDDVFIPLLEGVIPVVITLVSGSAILQLCFGFDLTGAWLTLGGGAFVVGLAVREILANFFSGITLLLDSPFQFGDVLSIESGGKRELGILRKIGVRVTHLYLFERHTEVYIPNSFMQNHNIVNLSRPIEAVFYSTPIEFDPNCDLERAKKVMQEIIQAHPDTLGNIETKLACLAKYYNCDTNGHSFLEKRENARQRLLAEKAVNETLEEIEHSLEALVLTLQFAEKGGLKKDDIKNVRREYESILESIGLSATDKMRPLSQLEETSDPQSLINLVRDWYRLWLRDPDVVDRDEYILSEIWERKINLLKKRAYKLYQKIRRPLRQETRLDDYVKQFVFWLKNRFKQARSKWQEPEIHMERIKKDMGYTYIEFSFNYYVDDIRLEDGERGIRVNSDIHREIMNHLKDACISNHLQHKPSQKVWEHSPKVS